MKMILTYLKHYKLESILAPAFKMLEVLFDLLVPLVVAQIIDVGIASGDRWYILQRALLLVGFALLGMASSFTAQFFAAKASVGAAADLRQAVYDHIQRLSYGELDRLGTGTLITRLTDDINQIQNGLNLALRLLLRSPLIVFGSMVMAFTVNVRCALVFAAAIPVLAVVIFFIMLVTIPLFKKAQARLDEVTGLTRENLTGVRVIRAFCREQDAVREFDEKNRALTRLNEFVGGISALLNPLTYVLVNFATIILIDRAGLEVHLGNMGQGDAVALYNYMAQMIVELIKLASLVISINKALACAGRVDKILKVQPGLAYPERRAAAETAESREAMTGAAAEGEAEKKREAVSGVAGRKDAAENVDPKEKGREPRESIRFEDVTFTYPGAAAPSLSHISFSVEQGQTLGIIGGTGSGKTSLVNLICRFYDVSSGRVLVEGADTRTYPKGDLLEKVGLVPQRAVLFKGSIRENLKWGNEHASDEELWQAIETAQAMDVVKGKKGELDFMVEQNGKNLSGGQKQRLTIARALVRHPEILILDDSASALDLATDAALRKALRRMEGSMTTVIVSQRISSIHSADRILVLENGRMAGWGSHEELLASCAAYQETYDSQYPGERISSLASAKEVMA